MKTRIDARLREEAAHFELRFACDDCVHFVPGRAACLHGYPASPRRENLGEDEIEFCKEFELGEGSTTP